ncbi:MAG: histidine--tRNA ligase [Candidatus Micrarchaeaceae archaeon]
MTNLPFPRGVRDLMPNEAIFRNEVLRKAEHVMQQFGFTTIDTPSFESLKLLYAKNAIGEDTKLIYELKNEDLGLRYDNTVSLARFVCMHKELPLPFKRYYIGKVWRRDEPQHLRYREFTQIDVDIVGGNELSADSEVMALGCKLFEAVGIDYIVKVNDRRIMDLALKKLGVSDALHMQVMRAIDKLDKMSISGVAKLLSDMGIESDKVDMIMSFVGLHGSNDDKLDYAEKLIGDKNLVDNMRSVLSTIKLYSIKGDIEVDFSTMRGFDYYTGIVFEFKTKDVNESLCGGGRYDKLIGLYGGRDIPAVGFAVGVDRMLDNLSFSSSPISTYAKVFIANVGAQNYEYAVKVANSLRNLGIPVDLNTSDKNLSNQLKYANAVKVPYVIIVGDHEEKMKKVKIRNLASGDEAVLEIGEVPKYIKRD